MIYQNSNGRFNYRIKFIFNQKIYIKIMMCKIMRFQKLMWYNIMRSTKNQKSFSFTLYYRFVHWQLREREREREFGAFNERVIENWVKEKLPQLFIFD